MKLLAASDFRLVYDLVDDWTARSLGAGWYRPVVEKRIAAQADLLVASADSLAGRLESATDRPVVHTVELLDWATGGPKPPELR